MFLGIILQNFITIIKYKILLVRELGKMRGFWWTILDGNYCPNYSVIRPVGKLLIFPVGIMLKCSSNIRTKRYLTFIRQWLMQFDLSASSVECSFPLFLYTLKTTLNASEKHLNFAVTRQKVIWCQNLYRVLKRSIAYTLNIVCFKSFKYQRFWWNIHSVIRRLSLSCHAELCQRV